MIGAWINTTGGGPFGCAHEVTQIGGTTVLTGTGAITGGGTINCVVWFNGVKWEGS
jgi:hypothetical protein